MPTTKNADGTTTTTNDPTNTPPAETPPANAAPARNPFVEAPITGRFLSILFGEDRISTTPVGPEVLAELILTYGQDNIKILEDQ